MNHVEQLGIAKKVAREAHKGQKRPIGGKDYITHPEAVALLVDDIKSEIVAWLHDVLEDSDLQPEDLEERGIDKDLVQSVVYLTRLPEESYVKYIEKVKEDEIARKVKICDLKHNLIDLKKGNLKDKYELALSCLHTEEKQ